MAPSEFTISALMLLMNIETLTQVHCVCHLS